MNRRHVLASLAFCAAVVATFPAAAQTPAPDAAKKAAKGPPGPRASPHDVASLNMDNAARVTIYYGRPNVVLRGKGDKRTVWGGQLVPSDKVWRTGADEATLLVVEKPITVGTATVPAGAYTLFSLFAADGSGKLIINKQVGQWGIDRTGTALRDEKQDLAVVALTKETLETELEQFTITIPRNPAPATGGMIKLAWANTAYSVPIAVAK
jgi:hypothetical protein